MISFYKELNLSSNCTAEEIKKNYRQLVLKYHPDKNKGFEEKFKAIVAAYEVLSDPARRQQYDQQNGIFSYGNGSTKNPSTAQGGFNSYAYRGHTRDHRANMNEARARAREEEAAAFVARERARAKAAREAIKEYRRQQEETRRRMEEIERQEVLKRKRAQQERLKAEVAEKARLMADIARREAELQAEFDRVRQKERERIIEEDRRKQAKENASREEAERILAITALHNEAKALGERLGYVNANGDWTLEFNKEFKEAINSSSDEFATLKSICRELRERIARKEHVKGQNAAAAAAAASEFTEPSGFKPGQRRHFTTKRKTVVDLTGDDDNDDDNPAQVEIGASETPRPRPGSKHNLEAKQPNGRPSSKRACLENIFDFDHVSEGLPETIPDQHNPKEQSWYGRGLGAQSTTTNTPPTMPNLPKELLTGPELEAFQQQVLAQGEIMAKEFAESFAYLRQHPPSYPSMPQPPEVFENLIERSRGPMRMMNDWFNQLMQLNNYCYEQQQKSRP